MRRTITVSRTLPAAVDAAALSEDPGSWLPAPATREGPRRWVIALTASGVSTTVWCTVGPPLPDDGAVRRLLRWEPIGGGAPWGPGRNLPELEAFIVITHGAESPEITLDGTYRAPLGLVGGLIDRLGMSRVARATAQDFLDEVVRRLTGAAV